MPPPDAWDFQAIGTTWRIESARQIDRGTRAAVLAAIDRMDRTWSRFRVDSVVSRAAERGGTWLIDDVDAALLDVYDRLERLTDGAFSPLVGGTLSDLGYDAAYSLTPLPDVRPVPPRGTWTWAAPHLVLDEPALIDVGAAGKGHLVDLVTRVLLDHGHDAVTVDASGDLRHGGPEPLRVALEHPGDPGRAVAVVELPPGRSLCASAINRRAWGDGLHHVLDGRTGWPVTDVVATWVVADSCLLADALATALFLVEPEVVVEDGVAWARLSAGGRLEWSAGLTEEVFA